MSALVWSQNGGKFNNHKWKLRSLGQRHASEYLGLLHGATTEERRCQRTVQILPVNPGKHSVTNTQNIQTLETVPENDIPEAATIKVGTEAETDWWLLMSGIKSVEHGCEKHVWMWKQCWPGWKCLQTLSPDWLKILMVRNRVIVVTFGVLTTSRLRLGFLLASTTKAWCYRLGLWCEWCFDIPGICTCNGIQNNPYNILQYVKMHLFIMVNFKFSFSELYYRVIDTIMWTVNTYKWVCFTLSGLK